MVTVRGRWFVAASVCVACAQIALFFPGYLSFDSAHQWWQSRHDEISSLSPPGQVLLLQALGFGDEASAWAFHAPSRLYALNFLLFWASCVYFFTRQRGLLASLFVFVAFALCPVVWVVFPHVWADVTLTAFLCVACALLDASNRAAMSVRRTKLLIFGAIGILFFSVLLRHNAILALAPLYFWASIRLNDEVARGKRRWSAPLLGAENLRRRSVGVLFSCLFAVALTIYALVPRWISASRADTWAITLIWDLQAISVSTARVLVPASISPDTTIEDLTQSFDPVFGINMYERSNAKWVNAALGLSASQRGDLFVAWLSAVMAHPGTYLSHRWHVFYKTLGPKRARTTDGSADEPGYYAFRDNPVLMPAFPAAQKWARCLIDAMKPRYWATPLVWMLLFSSVCVASWLRCRARGTRTSGNAMTASVSVWLSAVAYLLPLFVALPSAEMRYVLWPTVACIVAAALALGHNASTRSAVLPVYS